MRAVIVFLAWIFTATIVFAGEVILDDRSKAPSGITLTTDSLRERAGSFLRFACHVEKLTTTEIDTPRGRFTELSIPGFQHSATIGAPALPVMNKLVEVPFGAELEATVEESTVKTFPLAKIGIKNPIYPRQPPRRRDETRVSFAYEPSVYVTKGYYQDEIVSIEEIGQFRHMRVVLLKIAPVAYDAVEKKIEVRNDIRIKVTVKGAKLERTAKIKKDYASRYFSPFTSEILTPPSLRQNDPTTNGTPVCYLIVADRMFESSLKPFIEWKTSKGFKVVTAYTDTIGKTADQIKAYVHNLYNNPTADIPAPSFLLIVGDNEQVPAFKGKAGSHISDLYYATVTPNDTIPDILVGRFSAQTVDQLIPQIEKTLQYEKYEMPDPSFLKNTVLVAGWDSSHAVEWGWPQINYGAKYYFNAEHGMPNTRTFLSAGSGQNSSQIVSMVSTGCGFLNYTAHGSQTSWADPSFTLSNIDSLKNQGKYPLVVGNCCLTNSFQVANCFGEAWLRAKGKGAVGYIGGSNSTYWDEDLWWGNGFYPIVHPNPQGTPPEREQTKGGAYNGVFQGNYHSNAAMMLAGNLAVEQSNTSRRLYYWEVYHLMGDPALTTYWGVPQDNSVVSPQELKVGSGSIELKVSPGSSVAVSMNGELLGTTVSNEAGVAVVSLRQPATPGKATIVVTGDQRKPFLGTVNVVP